MTKLLSNKLQHNPVKDNLRLSLIEQWKLTGKIRKTSFFYNMVKKSAIRIVGVENLTESQLMGMANEIDILYTVLNRKYKENWDVDLEIQGNSFSYSIILHYPEVIMSNNNGATHKIKNLLVRIPISFNANNEVIFHTPEGTRTTYSYLEYINGYTHSHLNSKSIESTPSLIVNSLSKLNRFCIGSGTGLDYYITESLSMSSLTDFGFESSEQAYESYFENIDSLVEWESGEGGPYKYFEKLSKYGSRSYMGKNMGYIPDIVTETVISIIKQNANNLDLRFSLNDNFIEIIINYKLQNRIAELLIENYNLPNIRYCMDYVVLPNPDCTGYSTYFFTYDTSLDVVDSIGIVNYDENTPTYYAFRNKKMYYEIEETEVNYVADKNYILHPSLVKRIKEILNKKINEIAIRKFTIKKTFESYNA